MRYLTKLAVVFVVLALLGAACSESADDGSVDAAGDDSSDDTTDVSADDNADDTADDTGDDTADDTAADDTGDDAPLGDPPFEGDTVVERFAGIEWTFGTMPDTPVAADPDAEPIVIGMVNQENTPLGSFPEMRGATEAAVAWVNAELGGVGGRPLEFVSCVTSFSVEQSQACAQEMVQAGVLALVGGIDVTSNGSFPVFEQNGIPQLGGIPANLVEQRSPVAFFFSGGTAGGMAAFVNHAKENGAETVLIAHGEFDSFTVAARDYGAAVGESLGMEVDVLSFPIVATDFLPVLNRAQQIEADAVILLAADSACVPIMDLFVDLGLSDTSQLYLTGACAGEEISDAAGDNIEGVIFNSEGPADDEAVEGTIFTEVTDMYATGPSQAAGTVAFRGFMNLWGLMNELGPDDISSESILERARGAVDHPSYWGHAYTCDGNQVPGLSALCAPQQTLMTIENGELVLFGDWIDTVALFADAGVG